MAGRLDVVELVGRVSVWFVPLLLVALPVWAHWRGVAVYDAFVEGASEGLKIGAEVFPFLLAIFLGVDLFRQTGALDAFVHVASPVLKTIGLPAEVVPLILVRPLSGSASLGILADILRGAGPDGLAGHLASIIQGSADTTFYVLSVYYGAVAVRRTRWSLAVGLIGDLVAVSTAILVSRLFFR